MSREPTSKSHATSWVLSVLAVLLLYAASWPLVEVKVGRGRYELDPFSDGYVYTDDLPPKWMQVLYQPIYFLRDTHLANELLWSYHQWWVKVLVTKPPPPKPLK